MAFVPQTVISPQLQMRVGEAQQLDFQFLNAAGAALDPSGYDALTLNVFAQVNGSAYKIASVDATGKAAFSTPDTTVTFAAADVAAISALPQGNYTYAFTGKPTSGDTDETLANGSMQLIESA